EKLFHPVRDLATQAAVSYYTIPVVASDGPTPGPAAGPVPMVHELMWLPAPVESDPPALRVPLLPALLYDPMDIASGRSTDPLNKNQDKDNIYSFRMRFG